MYCLIKSPILFAVTPDRFAACIELLHDLVAIAEPAARFAVLDVATQPAVGLGGQILEEQCVHRALEADVKFADLALSQRDDGHAGTLQVPVELGHIGLIA